MADIQLNVNGDSSGASGALREAGGAVGELGEDVGKSVVKWQEFANITKQAIEMVVRFGVDAVKAYAESERVQKQLTRAAGDYADALSDQAEALSKKYAIDDDIIKQSQVLLTQWGGVGAATEDVTKAVLNYAAATGQDAVAATSDLIRNVESGGAGLAKMGVHFNATGEKGKDLAAAVDALNKKFGGAAEADAASLTGSLHGAELAFEDLKKGIGESISSFLEHTGAVGMLTGAIRELDEFITQKGAKSLHDEAMRTADLALAKKELLNAQEELNAAMMEGASQTIIDLFSEDVTRAQAKLDALTASSKSLVLPAVEGKTNRSMKEDEAAADANSKKMAEIQRKNIEDFKKYQQDWDDVDERARQQEEQSFAESLAAEGKHVADSLKARQDAQKAYDEVRVSEEKRTAEHQEKLAQLSVEAEKKQMEATKKSIEQQQKDWAQAADQIGAAFVNALGDQLSKLAAGEEFDAAVFVGDILASVISVAATVIGTAYGQPALGAAVGNLASMGVRAGAAAISKGNKKKYHSGGWIGDEAELPRYHSGGYLAPDEVPMIGQKGEYMLSRRNVQDMGGPAGVERAIKGGSGPTISLSVMAIDAKNAAEGFVGELGAGLKRALRTGQGDVPALLGVSPR